MSGSTTPKATSIPSASRNSSSQSAVEALYESVYPDFAPPTAIVPDKSSEEEGKARRTASAPACLLNDGREIEPAPKRFTVSVQSGSTSTTVVSSPSSCGHHSVGEPEAVSGNGSSPVPPIPAPDAIPMASEESFQVTPTSIPGASLPFSASPTKHAKYIASKAQELSGPSQSTGSAFGLSNIDMPGYEGPPSFPNVPYMSQPLVQQRA